MTEKESDNFDNQEENVSEEGNTSENSSGTEDQMHEDKQSSDEDNEKINSEDIISLTTKGFKFKDTDNLYLQDKPDMMETSLKFIPYYCWSNRGENEMLVWVNEN